MDSLYNTLRVPHSAGLRLPRPRDGQPAAATESAPLARAALADGRRNDAHRLVRQIDALALAVVKVEEEAQLRAPASGR